MKIIETNKKIINLIKPKFLSNPELGSSDINELKIKYKYKINSILIIGAFIQSKFFFVIIRITKKISNIKIFNKDAAGPIIIERGKNANKAKKSLLIIF